MNVGKEQVRARFARYLDQAGWEIGRYARTFTRCFGILGWAMVLCGVIGILALISLFSFESRAKSLQRQLISSYKLAPSEPVKEPEGISSQAEDRLRLQAFEDHLLAHDDIPVVVQDLLNLAEDQGLQMQRGDYRAYVDPAGNFLRYRMILPIKGSATSIYRFMQLALEKQKNLALSSVQFKRERIDSSEVEANIHWVVLTHLPPSDTKIKIDVERGMQ